MVSDLSHACTLESRVVLSLASVITDFSRDIHIGALSRDRLQQHRTRAKKLQKQNNLKNPTGIEGGIWVYLHLQITNKFWKDQVTARDGCLSCWSVPQTALVPSSPGLTRPVPLS